MPFEEVCSDAKNNWVNTASNDFEHLIPVATKEGKSALKSMLVKAVCSQYSLGVSTNRDDWLIDLIPRNLEQKLQFFIDHYQKQLGRGEVDQVIKWSETLLRRSRAGASEPYSGRQITATLYRPFVKFVTYETAVYVDRPGLAKYLFPAGKANTAICLMAGDRQDFSAIATEVVPNLNLYSADAVQYLPLFRFDEEQEQSDNITDWSLDQFKTHYQPSPGKKDRPITKEAIFHYVYGVLHDPVYREKYALNLKREFPRIPFYTDFWQWADWGKILMDLHIGYEAVAPFALKRTDIPDEKARKAGLPPKAM